jgi:hypothetical protein
MLLLTIDSRLPMFFRAIILGICVVSPRATIDILKAFRYRREVSANPFLSLPSDYERPIRESEWSEGEKEFIERFVSVLNHCAY